MALEGIFSPAALVCWRLTTPGLAGQATRMATVHIPRVSGSNCSIFGMQRNGFTLILVLLYQSLRLLSFSIQARLTAINQEHSYAVSCQAYLDGYMGV